MSETAVLFSGGLDSAVLLAHEARHGTVHPLYVSVGLAWEADERALAARLIASPRFRDRVRPLASLAFTMQDVYPATHWAIQGTPPGWDTPDEDVYLAGRNIVLLSKAGTWCAQRGVGRIVLGPLAGNPFPDAQPAFFRAMAEALSLGLDRPLTIATPLAGMHKKDVVLLGASLGVPFELTLSCMNPLDGRPCRRCSKCRERHLAFLEAGLEDPAVAPTLGESSGPR